MASPGRVAAGTNSSDDGYERPGQSQQMHMQQQQQHQRQPQQQRGSGLNQSQQQRGSGLNQPYIGWDLTLHPSALNNAYWRERAPRHSQWDYQVVLFLMVTLLALTTRFMQQMDLTRATLSFGVAWVMLIVWLLALHSPTFYTAHRIPLVLLGRVMMALASYLATNGVQEQLYKTLLFRSAALSLVLKIFLFCNTGQMPVESVRLQLPILWQVAGTGAKAVMLFLSDFTTEFVVFCNIPRYLAALDMLNATWASLVQSGAPIPLPVSSLLAGRSGGAVMAVTTVWMSVVLLIGYLCYISLWSDIRLWLAGKAREAQQDDSGTATVVINGVAVTGDHLMGMCQTPFSLLLTARSAAGMLARLLLHLGLVNAICMVACVLSHVLIQLLLPNLLPATLLDAYFRQLPMEHA